jgi:hypothetical protein
LKFALTLGYTIDPIDGYRFEKGVDIFTDYINDIYNKKVECEQNNDIVGRLLYKLQANSFYGRFGMHEAEVECALVDESEFVNIASSFEIKSAAFIEDEEDDMGSSEPASESKIIVEYMKQPDPELCGSDERFFKLLDKTDRERRKRLISVGISAAVTSYAQILMYEFISREDAIYTDTDSVCLAKPLPQEYITNKLGSMKLEAEVKYGLFIKPKVYYMETTQKIIKKFKGVSSDIVEKDDYLKLLRSETLSYKTTRLYKDKLNGITSREITLHMSPPDDTKRIRVFSKETGE